jgi:integrase
MSERTLPPGVYLYRDGRYKAHPSLGGQMVYLGIHDTVEDAVEAIGLARERHEIGASARKRDTYLAWALDWLNERETSGAHRSSRTDRSRMERHVFPSAWADMPIRTIRARDLTEWLHELERAHASSFGAKGAQVATARRISPQTVKHVCNLVRKSFADAIRAGKVNDNPATEIRPRRSPKVEKGVHLTQAQIDRLLGVPGLPERFHRIYTVAIFTGVRSGELWALRWDDVHEEAAKPEIVVRRSHRGKTKTEEIRHVPLLPPAIAAIRAQRAEAIDSPLVFPSGAKGHGKGWSGWHQASEGYDAQWGTWAKKAGIDTGRLKFRHLRHTCGAHLAAGTWGFALTLYQVAAWLGHADSRTTEEHYAHLTPDALHGARAKLDKHWPQPEE